MANYPRVDETRLSPSRGVTVNQLVSIFRVEGASNKLHLRLVFKWIVLTEGTRQAGEVTYSVTILERNH